MKPVGEIVNRYVYVASALAERDVEASSMPGDGLRSRRLSDNLGKVSRREHRLATEKVSKVGEDFLLRHVASVASPRGIEPLIES